MIKSLPFMIWSIGSTLWILAWLGYFLFAWPSTMAPINKQFDKRELTCKTRYYEKAPQGRCILIMDLERYQARSIAMANRALAMFVPPILGFVAVRVFRSRVQGSGKKKSPGKYKSNDKP